MDEAARKHILAANDAMTRDALRVLGVAYRVVTEAPEAEDHRDELEKDLIFVGLDRHDRPGPRRRSSSPCTKPPRPASAPS